MASSQQQYYAQPQQPTVVLQAPRGGFSNGIVDGIFGIVNMIFAIVILSAQDGTSTYIWALTGNDDEQYAGAEIDFGLSKVNAKVDVPGYGNQEKAVDYDDVCKLFSHLSSSECEVEDDCDHTQSSAKALTAFSVLVLILALAVVVAAVLRRHKRSGGMDPTLVIHLII